MFPPRSNTTSPTPPTPPNSSTTFSSSSIPSTTTHTIRRTLLSCITPRLGPSRRQQPQPQPPQAQTQTPARIWLFTRAAPSEKWTASGANAEGAGRVPSEHARPALAAAVLTETETMETRTTNDVEGMSGSTLLGSDPDGDDDDETEDGEGEGEEGWRVLHHHDTSPSPSPSLIDWSSTLATAGSLPSASISSRSTLHFSSSSSDTDSDIGPLYCDPSPPPSPSHSPPPSPTPTRPLSPQTRSFLLAAERARTRLLLSIRYPSLAEENCDKTEDVEAVLRENYAAIVSFAGTADEEAREVARRSGVVPVGWVVRDSLDLRR